MCIRDSVSFLKSKKTLEFLKLVAKTSNAKPAIQRLLRVVEEDVFRYLEAAPEAAFDLVIVDPPKFAPNRQALDAALKGYRKLNALAMRAARVSAKRRSSTKPELE